MVFSGVILMSLIAVLIAMIYSTGKESPKSTYRTDRVILGLCNFGILALIIEQVCEAFELRQTPLGGLSVVSVMVPIFLCFLVITTLVRLDERKWGGGDDRGYWLPFTLDFHYRRPTPSEALDQRSPRTDTST